MFLSNPFKLATLDESGNLIPFRYGGSPMGTAPGDTIICATFDEEGNQVPIPFFGGALGGAVPEVYSLLSEIPHNTLSRHTHPIVETIDELGDINKRGDIGLLIDKSPGWTRHVEPFIFVQHAAGANVKTFRSDAFYINKEPNFELLAPEDGPATGGVFLVSGESPFAIALFGATLFEMIAVPPPTPMIDCILWMDLNNSAGLYMWCGADYTIPFDNDDEDDPPESVKTVLINLLANTWYNLGLVDGLIENIPQTELDEDGIDASLIKVDFDSVPFLNTGYKNVEGANNWDIEHDDGLNPEPTGLHVYASNKSYIPLSRLMYKNNDEDWTGVEL